MRVRSYRVCLYPVLVLAFCSGCGYVADPDRIVVARIDGEPIRREDLSEVLRKMMPEERPLVDSRADLLRVLEEHVDRQLKHRLGEALQAQGQVSVPREQAAAVFDAKHPDYARWLENREALDMSPADIEFVETERDLRIDQVHKDLLGEAAVHYQAEKEAEAGNIEITEGDYREAYEARRDELQKPEVVGFEGVFVPVQVPDASGLATSVRERLLAGEDPQTVAAELAAAGTGSFLAAELVNDPLRYSKFGTFWQEATGAQQGEVIGPVFIRGWQKVEPSTGRAENIPDAFLVAKVTKAQAATELSLEEAKEMLRPVLLYEKMMEKLRRDHEVEIYEKNLPDPAAYDSGRRE